jgi:acetylornithine/N-succinyldiaminopimelate aminotransferase
MVDAVMPTYGRIDVAFARGEGAHLIDEDGKKYLDFATGIAVNCLGHSHPGLISAVQEQAAKLMHVSNLYRISGQERAAQRLVDNSFADTVFFGNSGAEACECSIKMARKYQSGNGHPERFRIITFESAFHGRTLATIAATGTEKVLAGFGPAVDGFDKVAWADADAARAAITEETAAIMVEPVQGEGGIKVMPDGFLTTLREICDANDLLLILDEVQSGMGRTGKLLAHEWHGMSPDIVALGKGLGGGFPIGACIATAKAAEYMTAGSHGSTYGGNPLGVAAVNAVLDELLSVDFLPTVRANGEKLRGKLEDLIRRNDSVFAEVRGQGLFLGLQCKDSNMDMVGKLRDAGMLTVPAEENIVRLLPPLNIGDAEIDEAMAILEQVCRDTQSAGDAGS